MEQKDAVLAILDEKKIPYGIVEHPPVYTIEEMENLALGDHGEIAKNLFLRNANGKRHFLVVLTHEKKVNLKELQAALGVSALSFASENRLMKYLGLTKGAVTPLGILNEGARQVEVVFDMDLRERERLGVHPNDNRATLWLSFADLEALVKSRGNAIHYIDFSEIGGTKTI